MSADRSLSGSRLARLTGGAAVLALLATLGSCNNPGSPQGQADRTAARADAAAAADDTGRALGHAADATGHALDDAAAKTGEAVSDTANDAKPALDGAAHDTVHALDRAGAAASRAAAKAAGDLAKASLHADRALNRDAERLDERSSN